MVAAPISVVPTVVHVKSARDHDEEDHKIITIGPEASHPAPNRSPNRKTSWVRQTSMLTEPEEPVVAESIIKPVVPDTSVRCGARVFRNCIRRAHPAFLLCICTLSWALARTFSPAPFGLMDDPDGMQKSDGIRQAGVAQETTAICAGKRLCVCPRETICATNWWSMVLLLIARCSAYFDYPMYMLLFLTKARNLGTFLQNSYLSVLFPLHDLHGLHELAGSVVALEVFLHTIAHIIRWLLNGELSLLWKSQTGITGLSAVALVPLIAWVPMIQKIKTRWSFELRKALHYLSILWGVIICFHAPKTHIFYVIGIPVFIYLLDSVYGLFSTTHFAPTLHMKRLGKSAVEIHFRNPQSFSTERPGFIYLCLPWISNVQWHAFSVYSKPGKENYSSVCIAAAGDWTRRLHEQLARPSVRPGWICGPFPAPSSTSVQYDNILCIASGIGITPAIAALEALKDNRCVSVIWVCRESAIIEYFLGCLSFDTKAWTVVYYTGSQRLHLDQSVFDGRPRLRLLQGRPNLEGTALEIMASIETGTELSDRLMGASERFHQCILLGDKKVAFRDRVCSALEPYSVRELYNMVKQYVTPANIHAQAPRVALSPRSSITTKSSQETEGTSTKGFPGLLVNAESSSSKGNLSDDKKGDEHRKTSKGYADANPAWNRRRRPSELSTFSKHSIQHSLSSEDFKNVELTKRVFNLLLTQVLEDAEEDLLEELFEDCDADGGGTVDMCEFLQAFKGPILSSGENDADASSRVVDTNSGVEFKDNVGEGQSPEWDSTWQSTWQLFYCGNSKPMISCAKKISHKYSIDLKVESFGW